MRSLRDCLRLSAFRRGDAGLLEPPYTCRNVNWRKDLDSFKLLVSRIQPHEKELSSNYHLPTVL